MTEHERPDWSVSWDEGYEAGKRAERRAIVRYLQSEGVDLYAALIEDGLYRLKTAHSDGRNDA